MILYFSGTGNSLALARKVAERTNERVVSLYEAVGMDLSHEKRIGCGICTKVCPQSNIVLTDKKACIGNACAACLACMHYCPQQAIEVDHKPTLPERQYHHPNIRLKDMIR